MTEKWSDNKRYREGDEVLLNGRRHIYENGMFKPCGIKVEKVDIKFKDGRSFGVGDNTKTAKEILDEMIEEQAQARSKAFRRKRTASGQTEEDVNETIKGLNDTWAEFSGSFDDLNYSSFFKGMFKPTGATGGNGSAHTTGARGGGAAYSRFWDAGGGGGTRGESHAADAAGYAFWPGGTPEDPLGRGNQKPETVTLTRVCNGDQWGRLYKKWAARPSFGRHYGDVTVNDRDGKRWVIRDLRGERILFTDGYQVSAVLEEAP